MKYLLPITAIAAIAALIIYRRLNPKEEWIQILSNGRYEHYKTIESLLEASRIKTDSEGVGY